MSSGNYGYVILKNGIPVGGGSTRHHVTHALMDMFTNYSVPAGRIEGIIRSIEKLERREITVWRVNGDKSADITDKIVEIQVARLTKERGDV